MTFEEIDRLIREAMKAWEAPGTAVVVVQGDTVVYCEGAGVRELGKPEVATSDTLFAIASTTKAFTCTAIAMLAEEGKLSWDDPVRKHLDWFRLSDPLADANVTLRDLVTHRTGYSRNDMLWFGSENSQVEALKKFGLVKPNTSFRSMWEYNNLCYSAAGLAAGNAAGCSWEELIRSRIFEPLGMTNSNFRVSEAQASPNHASAHEKTLDGKIRVVPWRNIDNCRPGGGINSNVRDLANWLKFQVGRGTFEGKTLLSVEKLEETRTSQIVEPKDERSRRAQPNSQFFNYGLGWALYDYRGKKVASHGGALDGFRTVVAIVPEINLGVAIVVNIAPNNYVGALRDSILDLAFGAEKTDWNSHYQGIYQEAVDELLKKEEERDSKRHSDTSPSHPLKDYAGIYENPAYGSLEITLQNDKLKLKWSWYECELSHFHFDVFKATIEFPRVNELASFSLDKEGNLAGVEFIGQLFQKSKPK